MEIFIWIVVGVLAFFALTKGADLFLAQARKLGSMIGINAFLLGAIIIGFGTSLPELVSSLVAVVVGNPDIVIPNIIGSNVANVCFILGIAAIIGLRFDARRTVFEDRRALMLLGSTILFILLVFTGFLSFHESVILFILGLINIYYFIVDNKSRSFSSTTNTILGAEYVKTFGAMLFGLLLLTVGANYIVESIIQISAILNISVAAFSASVIAFGTSLPELVVVIRLTMQKKAQEIFGTIVGSNIFNILIVGGIPGLFATLPVTETIGFTGLLFLLMSSISLAMVAFTRFFNKLEGVVFIMLYVVFIIAIFF